MHKVLGRRLIKQIGMWYDKIVSNLEFVSSLVLQKALSFSRH